MLSQWMEQLAEEMGQKTSYTTEVPGVFAFPVDEETTVSLTELPEGFALHALVSKAPKKNGEEFLTQMMFANLYGQATEGCVLGLDESGKTLTLSCDIDYSCNYKEFRDILEDFVNSVDFWREEAQTYQEKKPTSSKE